MSSPITVSMYNVGFGDCFLLRFPHPGGGREGRMLIDCGTIKRGEHNGTSIDIEDVVAQIIGDVRDADGVPRIDVVAMSHRHKDHVSGFSLPAWAEVEVGEVWMPWIEDPDDPEGQRILHDMSAFAATLLGEFRRLQAVGMLDAAETELIVHVIENTLDLSHRTQEADLAGLDIAALSNEDAMATLHRGFLGGSQGATRVFLHRTRPSAPRRPIPGVDIHVLGPSDREDVIADMDPPSNESFLRASMSAEGDGGTMLPYEGRSVAEGDPIDGVSGELVALLRSLSQDSTVLAAAALEKAVNNTSLFLAIEYGSALLLFPGDSQWGSWKSVLDDPSRRDLIRRTSFFKVGHHGSHNANPRSFVEDPLLSKLWGAAASVTPHGRFGRIPEPDLLDALRVRLEAAGPGVAGLVRSDQRPAAADLPDCVNIDNELRTDFIVPTG
jgi:hypothetical protein